MIDNICFLAKIKLKLHITAVELYKTKAKQLQKCLSKGEATCNDKFKNDLKRLEVI